MDFSLKNSVKTVINTIENVGGEAYIVGGCVRDILLSRTPEDFDVTASLLPEEILSLFPKTVATGLKHGTVTVIIDNENIEVTTFRTDGTYSDSRHPESVNFVKNINEDLARRDFTINAMAYSDNIGLIDLYGGQDDLNNKILRTVGNPEKRFKEDALRILRLFRFSAQLGFRIEECTLKTALMMADSLKNISRERIATELFKALCSDYPTKINPLLKIGALEFCGIKSGEITDDIALLPKERNIRFYKFSKQLNSEHSLITEHLKTDKKLSLICKEIDAIIDKPPISITDCKLLLKDYSSEAVKSTLILNGRSDEIVANTKSSGEPYQLSQLNINGEDLKKLGINGKSIGKTLEELLLFVIHYPEKNTKAELIKLISNKS